MGERYTIISEEKGRHFLCPFPVANEEGWLRVICVAGKCMAWIEELDGQGHPTGRGRCGMVAARIERAPA